MTQNSTAFTCTQHLSTFMEIVCVAQYAGQIGDDGQTDGRYQTCYIPATQSITIKQHNVLWNLRGGLNTGVVASNKHCSRDDLLRNQLCSIIKDTL